MRRSLRLRAASEACSTHSTEGGLTIGKFHIRGAAKRRGGCLPARLRFSAHRGVTLIELMISMLILTLVCVAWLEIIGIQSAKKEARRREAVERLAGMMDAFSDTCKAKSILDVEDGAYEMALDIALGKLQFKRSGVNVTHFIFDDEESPISYRLRVLYDFDSLGNGWGGNSTWLVGQLYDHQGNINDKVDRSFCTLSICLGL